MVLEHSLRLSLETSTSQTISQNLLKNLINITTSVIKNVNQTTQQLQLQIDEKTFNEDTDQIDLIIHLTAEANLKILEVHEKLMESYLILDDNLNEILNSITIARLIIIHKLILSPDHQIAALPELAQNLFKTNLRFPVNIT